MAEMVSDGTFRHVNVKLCWSCK